MPFIALAVAVLFFMVLEALGVAISGSVFLHVPFVEGWDAAWDRPGYLLLFAIISLIFRLRD